jgi:hypothetical protein
MNFKPLAQLLEGKTYPTPSSSNQRAYADLIEEKAANQAQQMFSAEFKPAGSVRSPEDFLLQLDKNYLIDVKTRQLNTQFNMPNLISVDRLEKILSDSTRDLYYWLIDYEVGSSGECIIRHSEIRAVWSLPWEAVAIQNLGKGQLQIKDWSRMSVYLDDRASWLQDLRAVRKIFYLKQAEKFRRMAEKIKV